MQRYEFKTIYHAVYPRLRLALVIDGALIILINLTFTPLLFRANIPPAVVPTTQLFLLRQSTSGLAALLIIFGCLGIGLHLTQRVGSGVGATLVFHSCYYQ